MRLVVQEQGSGCAIACVASRLGISYKRARTLFKDPSASTSKGYFCKDICQALRKKGVHTVHRYMRPKFRSLATADGTIVYIKKCLRYPRGHYLLKTKQGWMNPWINYPDITPAKAGFQRRLPGRIQYVIFEVD